MAKGKKENTSKKFKSDRTNKFFGGNDLDLELSLGREYLTDINHTVLLFKVDYKKTKSHDLYGESKAHQKVVHKPIELQCRVTIEQGEEQFLAGIGVRKEYAGNLTFTVYDLELEEKQTNVTTGDYIGYVDGNGKLRYWEVAKADNINIENKKTINGIKSYYRQVMAVPVDRDVFAG